jgi:hypothetical protein
MIAAQGQPLYRTTRSETGDIPRRGAATLSGFANRVTKREANDCLTDDASS